MKLLFKFLVPLVPIANLAVTVQGLMACFYPEHAISQTFIKEANDVLMFELVLMHSGVFWALRKEMAKTRIKEIIFTLLLFATYGLFVLPLALSTPWIGTSYLLYSLSRLIVSEKNHWLMETAFFKKGLAKGAHSAFLSAYAILKLFAVGLGIPILVMLFSKESVSYVNAVKEILPQDHDISGSILVVKSLTLYFTLNLALEVYQVFNKFFKKSKPRTM